MGVTKFYMYLYGQRFTLCTDPKHLLKIFAPGAGTPALAAAQLQRWSLLLFSYQCNIQYRSSKELANVDALSRLPLSYYASIKECIYSEAGQQLHKHPVSAQCILQQLSQLMTTYLQEPYSLILMQNGWTITSCDDPELKPYVP